MVIANLSVLLDDTAPTRPGKVFAPATRRARNAELLSSVKTTTPYSIENHALSNAPNATIEVLRKLASKADYKCFSALAKVSESHHPGYAQHKFDGVWIDFWATFAACCVLQN